MSIGANIPDRVKTELNLSVAEAVRSYHEENDNKSDFSRNRVLDMETMIKLLISMQGGSLQKELHEAGIPTTASAFVQQRKKLSWIDFEKVFDEFNSYYTNHKTYKGYRILAVDGTAVNMPRNPNSESYMCNKSVPKGYNQLHVTPIYDVLNKIYLHCVIQPQLRQDEVGALKFMLEWYDFKEKTLIVADRGFESYNVFAHFMAKKVDFLIRVKQERTAMREVAKLPMKELDVDINFTITTTQTNKDKEKGYIFLQTRKNKNRIYSSNTSATRWDFPSPYPMKLRIVRFMLDTGQYETLATSLPRSFTLQEIKGLYHARWGIETAFRELKYGFGLVNLHGKNDDFVKQEIFSAMIMSNFCSRIAEKVVIEKPKRNIHAYKVNWNMAVYLCKKFYREENGNGKQLLKDIAKYTEPIRPNRNDERKIKVKNFVGFTYRVPA